VRCTELVKCEIHTKYLPQKPKGRDLLLGVKIILKWVSNRVFDVMWIHWATLYLIQDVHLSTIQYHHNYSTLLHLINNVYS
jgi:hypothetical protein